MKRRWGSPRKFLLRLPLILYPVLVAVLTSACASKVHDALQVIASAVLEKCYEADRASYETAMVFIGEAPETPEYPKTATYQVCYSRMSKEPISAQMIDGDAPIEDASAADERTEAADAGSFPEEAADEIPVGTYVGTTEMLALLDRWHLPGAPTGSVSTNEVGIDVAADGTVTGSLHVDYTSGALVRENAAGACTTIWHATLTGAFDGQLTGPEGTIELAWSEVCHTTGTCDTDGECSDETIVTPFEVQVAGDQIMGIFRMDEVEGWEEITWTFTAAKQ